MSLKKLPIIKLTLLGAFIGFACYATTLLYIVLNAEKNTLSNKTADIAIVLGATPYWDNQINPCLQARVLHAVDLYKKGKVKAIIVSGGKDPEGTITEAEVMKQIALDGGMEPAYIFEELKATSTFENIEYSQAGLDYYQTKSVVIVTEPYHSPRGELVANKLLDQEVFVSPAINSPCWQNGRYTHLYFLREPFAMLYYFFTGKM